MEYLPTSRSEAKSVGAKYYNTRSPCKNGHYSNRITADAHCIDCNVARNQSEAYREKYRKLASEYHKKNRDVVLAKMKERNAEYYKANREKVKAAALKYQRENASARTSYKKQWAKEKAAKDPAFKMSLAARRMLQRALGLSGQRKYKRTAEHLGYTSEQLAEHLESLFVDGMSWDNYGEWHIDHIESLKKLTDQGVKDLKVLNALSNLRPLWAEDNLKKGAK